MSQTIDFQTLLKNQLDTVVSLTDVVAKDVGKIVAEAQEFSVNSFQTNVVLMRKLAGAKNVSELIQAQTDHAKQTYDATIARSKKIGDLLTELSRNTIKTVATNPDTASTPIKAPSVGRRLQAAE
jgi:hypothetical protein